MHSVGVLLGGSPGLTLPAQFSDDQSAEEKSGDSHEHPDAPQDIRCRSTQDNGKISRCNGAGSRTGRRQSLSFQSGSVLSSSA
jgi:hypothetical protein